METTELTTAQLRSRMYAARVRVRDLAKAAGMYQSDVSAILNGHETLGPVRRAKLERGIRVLKLDRFDFTAPEDAYPGGPVFNIRKL